MNRAEREYFAALNRDRADSAEIFEKPANRKMWRSIVEKYTDQAHFVYELIQNADDAGADSARFILERDRLVFIHNGKRRFSISDPYTEDIDSDTGKLGDINSITGIAFSNKKSSQNKIGKFGVGFKSVFQYTSTPHIYDPEYWFKIVRYIIPVELEEDFPGRKAEETVFVFPFDNPDKTPEETYSDIEFKLSSLVNPVLFLTNLTSVSFETVTTSGMYKKNVEESVMIDGTAAERVNLIHTEGEKTQITRLWMFSRFDFSLRYSVGFCLDENGSLIPSDEPAYCYFPTREATGLGFLIHAPFLLTDSREGIKTGIPHNELMINLLSDLAAESLVYLRDIGLSESKMLINDSIFSIIPVDEEKYNSLSDTDKISFRPFCTKIKNIFALNEIIPAADGYVSSENAYWAAERELTDVFSDSQLSELCGVSGARWVFVSSGADDVQRSDSSLYLFISSVINTVVTEDDLLSGRSLNNWSDEKEIKGLDSEFMENQDMDWIIRLYLWISRSVHRISAAAKLPVFPDSSSVFSPAFDNYGNEILFMPSDGVSVYRTVREDMLENPVSAELLKKIGISRPSLKDEIFRVIIPKYENPDYIDEDGYDFTVFVKYFNECSHSLAEELISELKKFSFVRCVTEKYGAVYCQPEYAYILSEKLEKYFEIRKDVLFADMEFYCSLPGIERDEAESFLASAGVKTDITVSERIILPEEVRRRTDLPEVYSSGKIKYTEKYIDGLDILTEFTVKNKSEEKSLLIWNTLLDIIKKECRFGGLGNLLKGYCEYFSGSSQRTAFNSLVTQMLLSEEWLVNRNGHFLKASRMSYDMLSDMYEKKSDAAKELLRFLEIEYKETKEETSKPGITPININSEEKKNVSAPEDLKKYLDKIRYTGDEQETGKNRSIQFVFGKSGEAKTESLAADTVIPLMYGTEDKKILIISPSSEQADRLTETILKTAGAFSTGWLVRFGHTSDESMKESPVYRDRSFDISVLDRCTVVTTSEHFISDCFMPGDKSVYLKDIEWDNIITDESTIIPNAAQELLAHLLGLAGSSF